MIYDSNTVSIVEDSKYLIDIIISNYHVILAPAVKLATQLAKNSRNTVMILKGKLYYNVCNMVHVYNVLKMNVL